MFSRNMIAAHKIQYTELEMAASHQNFKTMKKLSVIGKKTPAYYAPLSLMQYPNSVYQHNATQIPQAITIISGCPSIACMEIINPENCSNWLSVLLPYWNVAYLLEYSILSFIPKRTLSAKQDVCDHTNTPNIRFRARLTFQYLRCNIICTANYILELPPCIINSSISAIMHIMRLHTHIFIQQQIVLYLKGYV